MLVSQVMALSCAPLCCDDEGATKEASAPTPVAAPAECPEPPPPPRASLAQRLGERVDKVVEACKSGDPLAYDPVAEARITGHWKGEYDDGGRTTEVTVTFRVHDHRLGGEMDEPNTFAAYAGSRLDSSIVGDVFADGHVVFMKTYTSPGVTHSVVYTGTLRDEARRIEGHWRVESKTGTFWLAKE